MSDEVEAPRHDRLVYYDDYYNDYGYGRPRVRRRAPRRYAEDGRRWTEERPSDRWSEEHALQAPHSPHETDTQLRELNEKLAQVLTRIDQVEAESQKKMGDLALEMETLKEDMSGLRSERAEWAEGAHERGAWGHRGKAPDVPAPAWPENGAMSYGYRVVASPTEMRPGESKLTSPVGGTGAFGPSSNATAHRLAEQGRPDRAGSKVARVPPPPIPPIPPASARPAPYASGSGSMGGGGVYGAGSGYGAQGYPTGASTFANSANFGHSNGVPDNFANSNVEPVNVGTYDGSGSFGPNIASGSFGPNNSNGHFGNNAAAPVSFGNSSTTRPGTATSSGKPLPQPYGDASVQSAAKRSAFTERMRRFVPFGNRQKPEEAPTDNVIISINTGKTVDLDVGSHRMPSLRRGASLQRRQTRPSQEPRAENKLYRMSVR